MVQRGLALLLFIVVAAAASAQDTGAAGGRGRRLSDDSPLREVFPQYWRDTTGDAAKPGGGELVRIDTLQTLMRYVYTHLPQLSPRAYVVQKQVRNGYQRAAFENIAFDLTRGDGISAVFQYVKMELEIAFSMQHKSFQAYGIPVPDDWSFPPDPYLHAWWRR